MAEQIKATSLAWKGIADMWNEYFAPPSRISDQEVEKYKEWLKKEEGKKALVLGATPEIRDALNDAGYQTTVIDINLEMILAMNSLVKTKDPDEVIVRGNWLDNPLQSSYFDVIIGDAVLPNVPWDKRESLLSEVKRLLKPGGVFLTRSFCVPREKPFKDIEELFTHFSGKDPTNQNSLQLVLELQILAYDPKDHLGTFSKPKEMIEKYRGKDGFEFESKNLNKLLDIVWDFWSKKFIGKVFVYNYLDKEEKEYQRYFEIKETFQATDNEYSKITPMYLLKNKNKS